MLERIVILIVFFCSFTQLYAQETKKSENVQQDGFLSNEKNNGDYLLALDKIGNILQSAGIEGEFSADVYLRFREIEQTDDKLKVIVHSVKTANLNIRNQKMYETVLKGLQTNLDEQSKFISRQDSLQNKIRNRITSLGKDKIINELLQDTLLHKQFNNELSAIGDSYKKNYDLLEKNAEELNNKKRIILENKTSVFRALQTVEERLQKSEISLVQKEYPFIWKTNTTIKKDDIPADFADRLSIEKAVTEYYIGYKSIGLIFIIILIGLLLFYVNTNLKYIRKAGYFRNLEKMDFRFLNKGAVASVLVLGLHLMILFNLFAPAVFTTLLHFFLLISIFFLFSENWQKRIKYNWLFLTALFVVFSFINLFVPVSFFERCIFILINVAAVYYIVKVLRNKRNILSKLKLFKWGGYIFIYLCLFSVVLNIFGRVSLSHTLSLTATVVLSEIITLSILVRIIIEIILLQIYKTRVKRGIVKVFHHNSLAANLRMPFIIIAVFILMIITASYLNIWGGVRSAAAIWLSHKINIGSFSFTLGGIFLFCGLIWLAHLLQKYVAYFFGEIEDEDEENINKKQHSKLLIIRLTVITGGYLLAVLASGIPLDKISIIIGALGVGVGLGLQGIVSNFVSGIILIFDRAIQIGDIIEINSQQGRVKSMDLRTTKIKAPNGSEIIIPNNSLLTQNITNWTFTDNLKQIEINFNLEGDTTFENISDTIQKALDEMPQIDHSRVYQIYYNSLSKDNYDILIKFWCSIYRIEEVVSLTKQNIFSHFEGQNIKTKI